MLILNNMQNNNIYSNNFSFNGHLGFEKLPFSYGIRNGVITETRLFRDYDTIKFAIQYIKKVFKGSKNIVVGACSTGEDVYSIKMLMGESPAKIMGFDLGVETIKKANSGIIELNIPMVKESLNNKNVVNIDTYDDNFLINNFPKNKKEIFLKKIFEKNFEPVKFKQTLIDKIKELVIKILDSTYIKLDKKLFKIKNNSSLEFKNGNIETLNEIVPAQEKNHLFSFKNALYHLITDNNYCSREPLAPKKIMSKLNNIFRNINKTLHKNGLFIMGEEENLQHQSINLVCKSLLDNGFLPIRMPNRPYLNIWTKVREID